MAKILAFCLVCLFSCSALYAQAESEAARKQELEKLKKQTAQKQAELKKQVFPNTEIQEYLSNQH